MAWISCLKSCSDGHVHRCKAFAGVWMTTKSGPGSKMYYMLQVSSSKIIKTYLFGNGGKGGDRDRGISVAIEGARRVSARRGGSQYLS